VAGIKNVRPGKKEKGEEESIKGGKCTSTATRTSPLEFAGVGFQTSKIVGMNKVCGCVV